MRFLPLALVSLGFLAFSATPLFADMIKRDVVVLRWLDKITARVDVVRIPVGQTANIQTLQIIARTCVESSPDETPESAAFLDVWETKAGAPAAEVFRGWMYASSPALSAMEHPVYDVWVIGCEAAGAKSSTTSAPESVRRGQKESAFNAFSNRSK